MDVAVTRKFRKRDVSSVGNSYDFSTSVVTGAGVTYVPVQPAIISFTATAAPGIINYQANYAALYGKYPRVSLITFDEDDNMIDRMEKPKRIIVADLLDSIIWDLGMEDTGIIILYPTA